MTKAKNKNWFLSFMAVTAWLAIILQLYLLLQNRQAEILPTLVQFFSYFTILTNMLVACYATLVSWRRLSQPGRWFAKPTVSTAVVVYIAMVGAVYNSVLRFLWNPQGLQFVIDELLHTFIPVSFIVYWIIWVPKIGLQWRHVFAWLCYPFAYSVYILIRGAFSGVYPYPFIDVTTLGYPSALLNTLFLYASFLLVSLLFVGLAKLLARKPIIASTEYK